MKAWMISDKVMADLEKYLGDAWSGNPRRRRLLKQVLEDRSEIIEPDLDNFGQLDDCRVWITRADANEFNIPAKGEVDGISD